MGVRYREPTELGRDTGPLAIDGQELRRKGRSGVVVSTPLKTPTNGTAVPAAAPEAIGPATLVSARGDGNRGERRTY